MNVKKEVRKFFLGQIVSLKIEPCLLFAGVLSAQVSFVNVALVRILNRSDF